MNLYEIGTRKRKGVFILNSRILYDMSGENFGKTIHWIIPATFICSILLLSYFKHVVFLWLISADCRSVESVDLWTDEQLQNIPLFCWVSVLCKKYSKQYKQLHICSQSGSTAWHSGSTAHHSL